MKRESILSTLIIALLTLSWLLVFSSHGEKAHAVDISQVTLRIEGMT